MLAFSIISSMVCSLQKPGLLNQAKFAGDNKYDSAFDWTKVKSKPPQSDQAYTHTHRQIAYGTFQELQYHAEWKQRNRNRHKSVWLALELF